MYFPEEADLDLVSWFLVVSLNLDGFPLNLMSGKSMRKMVRNVFPMKKIILS